MKRKSFVIAGTLAVVLMCGLILVGCPMDGDGGYTFAFKVNFLVGGGTINKIEFINGSNKNAEVLQTETVSLSSGELSSAYKISGFTEKNGDDYRLFGIKVSFEDGRSHFDYGYAANNTKIFVTFSGPILTMLFSEGNW